MRPRILIDVDGPLTRGFFTTVCEYLRDEGIAAQPHLINQWDVFAAFGVGGSEIERRVRERLWEPGLAKRFPVNRGAASFLMSLRARAVVYAVTAPLDGAPTWTHDREWWLFNRLGFSPERVIHARDKSIIGGDAFIDDRVSSVAAWATTHPNKLGIVWTETHNAIESWSGHRVATYESLATLLEGLR